MSTVSILQQAGKTDVRSQATNRIPTLDGWRGIAILMVISDHFQIYYLSNPVPFHHWSWLLMGAHGVAIFLVLSGYLITSRLLSEERIDLRRFYLRRFFRLMPTAWTYLVFLAVLGIFLGGKMLLGSEALSCLLFYRNFVWQDGQPLTIHFWSLSVEEQFYLVWPIVLALGGRYGRWFALAGIVICGLLVPLPRWPYGALLVGCALAFALQSDAIREWIRKHQWWILALALIGFAWCNAHYLFYPPLIESLFIALMLACTSLAPQSWLGRTLEQRHLKQIGVYSYSLYVWQQFFMITGGLGPLLLPVIGIVSWHYIEQPGIRLGARFLRRSSS